MGKSPKVKERGLYLSPVERRQRIEAVMSLRSWTWYRLAKEMNTNQTAMQRALKAAAGHRQDPSLDMLKRCARSLGVTVGFLVDREQ